MPLNRDKWLPDLDRLSILSELNGCADLSSIIDQLGTNWHSYRSTLDAQLQRSDSARVLRMHGPIGK